MEKYNINTEELEKLFNKYSPYQLEQIKTMIEFTYDSEKEKALEILDRTFKKKLFTCTNKEECYQYSPDYKMTELTNKELNYLYNLVDDVDMCLTSIENGYEQELLGNYELLVNLEKEQEKRKAKIRKNTNK